MIKSGFTFGFLRGQDEQSKKKHLCLMFQATRCEPSRTRIRSATLDVRRWYCASFIRENSGEQLHRLNTAQPADTFLNFQSHFDLQLNPPSPGSATKLRLKLHREEV